MFTLLRASGGVGARQPRSGPELAAGEGARTLAADDTVEERVSLGEAAA